VDQIATLRRMVLAVDDLDASATFWSRVTGLPIAGSPGSNRIRLGVEADRPWEQTLTLEQATAPKAVETNRVHLDLTIDDVDVAIAQIQVLGGGRKTAPSIYPRPGSFPGEPPVIDWDVMHDPSGNEFCLVRVLDDDEVAALEAAGVVGPTDDAHWREVARSARHGVTPPTAGALPVLGSGDCVGPLRCYVIDVNDLAVAQHFWNAVTGLTLIHSEWPGRFAYLGHEDETHWRHALILHRVDRVKTDEPNRGWLELEVDDIDLALRRVDAIGGAVADDSVADHVVLRDPFGNEFRLIRSDPR
jgi:predicted enzyme related to lactoylglutathione lyase